MRLMGIDPGLQRTGWGVIEVEGNRMRPLAAGVLRSTADRPLAARLAELYGGLAEVIATWRPAEVAVEETFVNKNPLSTLKLGQARGVAMLAPAVAGLPVHEYMPNSVKSAVVGAGHASKDQVAMMVHRLLPGLDLKAGDATDALAVAICHAHHAQTRRAWTGGVRSRTSQQLPPSPPRGEGRGEGAGDGTLEISPLESRRGQRRPRKASALETDRARDLRTSATDLESRLWRHLRNCACGGWKFRRQVPIVGFVADFACLEAALVIELDGGQHAEQAVQDARRTAVLEKAGFRVLRFWNHEMIEDFPSVIETIERALGGVAPAVGSQTPSRGSQTPSLGSPVTPSLGSQTPSLGSPVTPSLGSQTPSPQPSPRGGEGVAAVAGAAVVTAVAVEDVAP